MPSRKKSRKLRKSKRRGSRRRFGGKPDPYAADYPLINEYIASLEDNEKKAWVIEHLNMLPYDPAYTSSFSRNALVDSGLQAIDRIGKFMKYGNVEAVTW